MSELVVGVSDMRVSAHGNLITYALGSCIAVSAWDPETRTGGLLHYMLPESSMNPEKARQNPAMYADTGIPALFQALEKLGARARKCVVSLAGGAQVLDSQGVFHIGKRNYLAAKRVLWKHGVLISGEAVGGEVSRTVRLHVPTGRFSVQLPGGAEAELTNAGHKENLWRYAS